MCDCCSSGKEEITVAQRRPSCPEEIVSIVYVCKDCQSEYFTTGEEIRASFQAGNDTVAATNEAWDEFSDMLDSGIMFAFTPNILWLTL
jgi:hypothetical protein